MLRNLLEAGDNVKIPIGCIFPMVNTKSDFFSSSNTLFLRKNINLYLNYYRLKKNNQNAYTPWFCWGPTLFTIGRVPLILNSLGDLGFKNQPADLAPKLPIEIGQVAHQTRLFFGVL